MPTITLTKDVESETLHLPELRPFVGHRVEITVRESQASTQTEAAGRSALEELRGLWQRCQQPNWDGEAADAISPATYEVARRLLESLPSGSPLPAVTAEPDGHLNFEWYQAPRRMLSVSISSDGTLYWAALIGSEDPRGSCQFVDEFPQTLLYWIGPVYKRESEENHASHHTH